MNIKYDLSELERFFSRVSNVPKFESYLKSAVKDLSKTLLEMMKKRTPIGETRQLLTGWDDSIVVEKANGGFEVTLLNRCSYASSVNDGHIAKNQYGGPYKVKHRVKVLNPKQWQIGDAKWYVFGHFFVEEGIVDTDDKVEKIVYPHIEQWWEWCVNG